MNSTAYYFLTLVLLINNSISSQLGHDNATSTMLNNASFIVRCQAKGYMRGYRVNSSVNNSSFEEMKYVEKLNRCQSSKDIEVKELQLANEEFTKKFAFVEAEIQTLSIIIEELRSFKSKVEEEVRELQLANEEMRSNFSSQADEIQKLRSTKSKVVEEVRELQLANEEMRSNLSSQADKIQELRSTKSKVEEEVRELQLANDEMRRKLSSQEDGNQKFRAFTSKVTLLRKGYEYIEGLGFYKFHYEGADFQNAVRNCENEGTHLGVIDSEKEADEFSKLIRKNEHYRIWVGIHNPHKNRSFQSILGTSLNELGYKKWMPGEQDNYHGNEYCVYFDPP